MEQTRKIWKLCAQSTMLHHLPSQAKAASWAVRLLPPCFALDIPSTSMHGGALAGVPIHPCPYIRGAAHKVSLDACSSSQSDLSAVSRQHSAESMPYANSQLQSTVFTPCTGSEGAPASAQPEQPAVTGSSSSASPVEVDASKPTTTLQIRLCDGSRLTGKSWHAIVPICNCIGRLILQFIHLEMWLRQSMNGSDAASSCISIQYCELHALTLREILYRPMSFK